MTCLLFPAFVLAFGFAACWVLDSYDRMRRTITCRCGLQRAADVMVVDAVDARRCADALSDGCPRCMAQRKRRRKRRARVNG